MRNSGVFSAPVSRYFSTSPDGTLENFARDVREGLSRRPKQLPSKYLYDEVGSALFETISLLPQYGLTRAGMRVMRNSADEIAGRLSRPVIVAELGSGSGTNTRFLLQALADADSESVPYYPIDISLRALSKCQQELGNIDSVRIHPVQKNYLEGLAEVCSRRGAEDSLLVLFLGSTIGNFERPAALAFLRQIRNILTPGDMLLLATDLEKPVEQLILAYDDPLGVTAAFNLNLLLRINAELEADFRLELFRHVVRWEPTERRIEMHLQAQVSQQVNIPLAECTVSFEACETIWTESSHRYTVAEIRSMGESAGYHCRREWIDEEWPFAQSLFEAV